MNKLLSFMFTILLLFTMGCDQDEMPNIGGIVGPDTELYGCEGAAMYQWDEFEFATSLDQNETVWVGFELDETTLFNVNIDQAGFHCVIFNGCVGEMGNPPPIFDFQSIGNTQEVGILTEGTYHMEITNTRNRVDFTFSIALNDIVYGCVNNDALNYNPDANVGDGSCLFNNCNDEWLVMAYEELVLDCNGNCSPANWVGDGWCDDGAYAVYPNEEAYNNYQNCQAEGTDDCSQYLVSIDLYCADLNWDEGDCEAIDEGCSETEIEDCNGICAPESWLGDGYCDEGNYEYNGNPIFFNCEEFNNDNGDCNEGTLGRQIQQPKYPNGRIPIR